MPKTGVEAIKAEQKTANKEYQKWQAEDEKTGGDCEALEQMKYWDGYCRGLSKALDLLGEKH